MRNHWPLQTTNALTIYNRGIRLVPRRAPAQWDARKYWNLKIPIIINKIKKVCYFSKPPFHILCGVYSADKLYVSTHLFVSMEMKNAKVKKTKCLAPWSWFPISLFPSKNIVKLVPDFPISSKVWSWFLISKFPYFLRKNCEVSSSFPYFLDFCFR